MYAINNFGYPEDRTNYRSRQFNINGSKILVLSLRISLTMCEGLDINMYVDNQSNRRKGVPLGCSMLYLAFSANEFIQTILRMARLYVFSD